MYVSSPAHVFCSKLRTDCSVAELTVRFNTKCYHAMVADLLKRVSLKKMKKVSTAETKESEETY